MEDTQKNQMEISELKHTKIEIQCLAGYNNRMEREVNMKIKQQQ